MKSLVSLLIIILIFTTSIICFSSCAKDGTDGKDGADGKTPTIEISEDGYWVINGEKTDVKAEGKDGEPGKDGVGGSANENPQGLDFYLKDDGTYAVAIGNARYLSHIEIPELYCGKPVTEIAYDGFEGAQNLKSVTIANGVTSIGSRAFKSCTSLTSITIPDGVTSIGDSAFLNCSSLTSITIPDSVTSIGDSAFSNCSSLTSITIPDNVTSIGDSAFSNCSLLTSITIPDGVTSIGHYMFLNCSSLTSVTISDSITSIGDSAFSNCSSLTSITIPDNVTSIGDSAFSNCSSLTSITIPDSVTSIGDSVLYGCSSLTSITLPFIDRAMADFYGVNVDDLFYSHENSLPLKTIVVTSSTEIPDYAFIGCTSLTSFTIPEGVTSIGKSAFYCCHSLTSIVIPDGVTSIGDDAFCGCCRLVEVINRSSLDITKGNSDYGYAGYYAIEIHSGSSKIVEYEEYLFYTYDGVNYLLGYVGDETNLTLPESFNGKPYEIYKYAFYYCRSITSVVIPDGVTSIGNDAFYCCTSLTSIVIPDSVTSIGYYAFYGCDSLTDVYYTGTESQWNAIYVDSSGNDDLKNATIHYNYVPEN